MRTIPILLNHDHTKIIGTFEDGFVTFPPYLGPTRDEMFEIFGNCGVRINRMFIGEDGVERVERAEIVEFSYQQPAKPRERKV